MIIMEFDFDAPELEMPLYEFQCRDCGNRFSIRISYDEYGQQQVSCPACKSDSVKRRIERIRIGHSEEERLNQIADPAQMDAIDEDPVALGGMLRKMKNQMGEEIATGIRRRGGPVGEGADA